MKLAGLEIDIPIVLAPMAGAVGPELCAAVSNAGGLGILPLWHREPVEITTGVAAIRAITNKPFGLNFNNNYDQDGHLDAAIGSGVAIASFFWGLNGLHIRRAKDAGMTVLQTIGSAAEAKQAVEIGADIIVAQGWEAGGHVWGTVTTLALVPAVVDAVPSTPVIAAGGIADGRGLAAVLALGAAAGWIGTRFLLADEATVSAAGRDAVSAATENTTVIGKDDNPQWLDSAIRWIGPETHGSYRPKGSQLAGQSVALVKRQQPAAEIVREIWGEAKATIANLDLTS